MMASRYHIWMLQMGCCRHIDTEEWESWHVGSDAGLRDDFLNLLMETLRLLDKRFTTSFLWQHLAGNIQDRDLVT